VQDENNYEWKVTPVRWEEDRVEFLIRRVDLDEIVVYKRGMKPEDFPSIPYLTKYGSIIYLKNGELIPRDLMISVSIKEYEEKLGTDYMDAYAYNR
jgi:hypothetical protein